jgi:hypothetical protein
LFISRALLAFVHKNLVLAFSCATVDTGGSVEADVPVHSVSVVDLRHDDFTIG